MLRTRRASAEQNSDPESSNDPGTGLAAPQQGATPAPRGRQGRAMAMQGGLGNQVAVSLMGEGEQAAEVPEEEPAARDTVEESAANADEAPAEEDGAAVAEGEQAAEGEGDAAADGNEAAADAAADEGDAAAADAQGEEQAAAAQARAAQPQAAPPAAPTSSSPDLGAGSGRADVGGDPVSRQLWQAYSGHRPEEQAALNSASMGDLATFTGGVHATLAGHAAQLSNSVQGDVDAQVQAVWSAFAASEGQVQQAFAASRAQVDGAMQSALQSLDGAANAALTEISTAESEGMSAVTGGLEAQQARLDQVSNDAISAMNQDFGAKLAELRALGSQGQTQARTVGAQMAAAYRGRSGGGVEGKRNEARAQAAEKVTDQYAPQLVDLANEAANKVAGGQGNLSAMITQLVAPARTQLAQQRAGMEQAVQQQAEQARQQVTRQQQTAREAVEQQGAAANTELDAKESATVESLRASATESEAQIRDAGAAGSAHIEQCAADLSVTFDTEVAAIQAQLDSMDMPDSDDTRAAVDDVMARLSARQDEMTAQLDDARADLAASLADFAGQGVQKLQEGARAAASGASDVASQVAQGMQSAAGDFGTALADLSGQIHEGMSTMVQEGLAQASSTVDQTANALAEQRSRMVADLASAKGGIQSEIDKKIDEMRTSIGEEAEKAAAKIKDEPLWKRALGTLVNIVVTVVVFVAVAAVAVAALATIGLTGGLALLIAGAIAGAVASAAGLFAGSLVTGESKSWRDYASSMLFGAVAGALGMGAMKGGFALMSGFKGVLISAWGMSGADQLGDILFHGESFNLGEFVITGVLMTITAGLLKKFVSSGIDTWFKKLILPGANSWNTFQSKLASLGGIFQGISSTTRAQLYKLVTGMTSKSVGFVTRHVEWEVLEGFGHPIDTDKVDHPQPDDSSS